MQTIQSVRAQLDFENWLWKNFHPGEVLEGFVDDVQKQVAALSSVLDVDADVIASYLPLSPVVLAYVENANRDFRIPLSERPAGEMCREFCEGLPLSHESCVQVAIRIQEAILGQEVF